MRKALNRKNILIFLISGTLYAGIMAGFDWHDEKNFNYVRFLVNFFFFGLFLTASLHFASRNRSAKK